jgi:hypothetical protein
MECAALEYTILRLLELHETKGRAKSLQDVDLAVVTSAAIGEVRLCLQQLETRALVELVKASGPSYAVKLRYHRPRLRWLAGRLWCFHHRDDAARAAPCAADHVVRRFK